MTMTIAPRCEETTLTQGLGTLDLDGATSGNRDFVTTFGSGVSCNYTILDTLGAWETGIGTCTAAGPPDTLTREMVYASSAGGNTKLSLGPGTKYVYCEVPAQALANGVTTFTDGDATPSVLGGRVFKANNTALTSYTGFDDGVAGQEICIIAMNGNAKFNATGQIHNPAALDITLTSNDTIIYVNKGGAWVYVGSSTNG
jgi:hypothetical protein